MDQILTSVKKYLGIDDSCIHFDKDLIMHINSTFSILYQLGVGPEEGFFIEDKYSTWDEFIQESENLELVKTYVCLKVKLMFDPPTNSSHMDALNRLINEFEWRLNT